MQEIQTAQTWSYNNLDSPTYEPMPAVPITQIRLEEVFIPDPPQSTSTSDTYFPATSALPDPRPPVTAPHTYVDISPLHVHDTELARRPLRVIGARRGTHEGVEGWWIEKEWEVLAIPERKRLFLFGSGLASKRASGHARLNA